MNKMPETFSMNLTAGGYGLRVVWDAARREWVAYADCTSPTGRTLMVGRRDENPHMALGAAVNALKSAVVKIDKDAEADFLFPRDLVALAEHMARAAAYPTVHPESKPAEDQRADWVFLDKFDEDVDELSDEGVSVQLVLRDALTHLGRVVRRLVEREADRQAADG